MITHKKFTISYSSRCYLEGSHCKVRVNCLRKSRRGPNIWRSVRRYSMTLATTRSAPQSSTAQSPLTCPSGCLAIRSVKLLPPRVRLGVVVPNYNELCGQITAVEAASFSRFPEDKVGMKCRIRQHLKLYSFLHEILMFFIITPFLDGL